MQLARIGLHVSYCMYAAILHPMHVLCMCTCVDVGVGVQMKYLVARLSLEYLAHRYVGTQNLPISGFPS